jgi:hypothetical protein
MTWHLQKKLCEEVISLMTVSIPLVLIVGAVVFAAWRYMGLKAWQAVVCLLFGFLLAATTAAPSIQRLVTGLVQLLSGGR